MVLVEHIKRLRAACAVAHTGSTVRAAQALHLSQSSVTRAVQDMEIALGFGLFDRSGRGMQPTADGQALVQRVVRALDHLALVDGTSRGGARAASHAWLTSRFAQGVGQRHMTVLLHLAQTASESQSAQRLRISQSAVHQTLAQLEHLAGAALFVRARKGLRLTEAGETALQAVKLAGAELRQADDELALRQGVVQGRLVVGTLPFSTGHLLSEAVHLVLQAHPGMSITIVDGTYDALLHQLRHAEIDLIVGALRPALPGPDLMQETLFLDRLAVVARAGHPLGRRSHLQWADLRDAQWVMPMPNTPAQVAFEQALRIAGVSLPPNQLRVNSALMMQALLAQSDRLAMMSPRQVQREIAAGLLVELGVPVRHQPRMIGVICRADYMPSTAGRALQDAFRQVARQLAGGPGVLQSV